VFLAPFVLRDAPFPNDPLFSSPRCFLSFLRRFYFWDPPLLIALEIKPIHPDPQLRFQAALLSVWCLPSCFPFEVNFDAMGTNCRVVHTLKFPPCFRLPNFLCGLSACLLFLLFRFLPLLLFSFGGLDIALRPQWPLDPLSPSSRTPLSLVHRFPLVPPYLFPSVYTYAPFLKILLKKVFWLFSPHAQS